MSLIDLAGHVGVSRPTIYAYVSDKLPVPETRLTRIARITRKPIEFFLDGPRGLLDQSSLTKSKLDLIDAWLAPPDARRASELADEVLQVVEQHDDPKVEANVLHRAGNALILKGDFALSVGKLDRSRRLFERESENQLAAAVAQSLGLAYTNLGQLEQAEECFQFSQEMAAPEKRWKGALSLAALAERRGDFATANTILDLLSADPDSSNMALAYVAANRASTLLAQGRWLDCLRSIPDAYEQAVKIGLTDQQTELTLQRGQANIAAGNIEDGSIDIAIGKSMARVNGDRSRETIATIQEAILLARTGFLEEARAKSSNAHDTAVRLKLRRSESLALLALAEIAARKGQVETMESFARQAESHADTYGYVQAAASAWAWLALAGHERAADHYQSLLEVHAIRDIGWSPGMDAVFVAMRTRSREAVCHAASLLPADQDTFDRLNWGLIGLMQKQLETPEVEQGTHILWLETPSGLSRRSVAPIPLPWQQLFP